MCVGEVPRVGKRRQRQHGCPQGLGGWQWRSRGLEGGWQGAQAVREDLRVGLVGSAGDGGSGGRGGCPVGPGDPACSCWAECVQDRVRSRLQLDATWLGGCWWRSLTLAIGPSAVTT
jgi:hypothetical protein